MKERDRIHTPEIALGDYVLVATQLPALTLKSCCPDKRQG